MWRLTSTASRRTTRAASGVIVGALCVLTVVTGMPAPAHAVVTADSASAARSLAARSVLTDSEVALLFDGPLPNLSTRTSVPAITGNRAADWRIAGIALQRGYRYRGAPLDDLGFYQGRRLQRAAIDDLRALQAAMRREAGVQLTLTSAYRGVSAQRRIFLSRLRSAGIAARGRSVSTGEIARGQVDDILHTVMARAAPPGFSKHHTGYAIDVGSGGFVSFAFRNSAAWEWLTANDYENAMRFGWIPSYPDGSADQGPEPEPWEWVWIGRDGAACGRAGTCATGNVDTLSRRRVTGWAVSPSGEPVRRLRLVTATTRNRLDARSVLRFDLEVVYGLDPGLSFEARTRVPRKANWACVEGRSSPGGPWARVGCLDLS